MIYLSDHESWMDDVLKNHRRAAVRKVAELLRGTTTNDKRCRVTATTTRKKVTFQGTQTNAYRFVFCVVNEKVLSPNEVVRHRCHNPLCINPDHLEVGDRAENKRDDWQFAAFGVDPRFL